MLRLSKQYFPRKIGDRYFVFPVGQMIAEGMSAIEVNSTVFDIVLSLENGKTFQELVDEMVAKYEASEEEKETVEHMVSHCVTKLLEFNKLLIND